jgi:hypothetical protein
VRRRQFQIRRIDDLGYERTATGDFDGLGAMVCFIASCLTSAPGFCAAEILGAGEFISTVVDHVVA